MNWINVNDQLPETIEEIKIKPEENYSPERTKKLIVLTNKENITDNFRLRMAVGDKAWTWFMGYEEDEEITHWMVFYEPKEIQYERLYQKVLELVKTGITIQKACRMAGIDRTTFYKNITEDEKKELKFHKGTITLGQGRNRNGFSPNDFIALEGREYE